MFTKESRTSARRRGEISRWKWDACHRDGYRSLQLELLEDRQLLDAALGPDAVALWNASPTLFTANEGQWADESIRYAFHGSGMNVLHTDGGPVIELLQDDARDLSDGRAATEKMFDLVGKHVQPPNRTEVTLSFDGAQHVEPVGLDPSQAVDNFFVGDQSNWRSQVATYETVGYLDLYDGVDLYTWGSGAL